MFIKVLFQFAAILFIFFVITIIYKVIRFYLTFKGAFSDSPLRKEESEGGVYSGKTVKCENCKTYVATELSVMGKKKGAVLFFCSEECKEENLRG